MKAGLQIAGDVVRASVEGRGLLFVIACLFLFFGFLLATLDLEVVEGALTAFRLFGQQDGAEAWAHLGAQLGALVHVAVLGFGIVAGSGAAPALLAPGRVEAMLALPVSRAELVTGTYLGVLGLACASGAVAAAGIAAILWWKVSLLPWVPVVGALSAVVAFAPTYAVMLLVATLVRSAPVGVGAGFGFWIVGSLSSARRELVSAIEDPLAARVFELVLAPIPPLSHLFLAPFAVELRPELRVDALTAAGASGLFASAMLLLALWVVSRKDY